MTFLTPPAADDADAYTGIDHREAPDAIVEYVASLLAPEHVLAARVDDDTEQLYATYRGQEHRIPLTLRWYDQYVVISSLAELLKDDYRFFVLAPSLASDTHALLVAPIADALSWVPLPEHLMPLEFGFDYFGKIRVPYLNHEDSAPDFARESGAQNEMQDALQQVLSGLLAGKADPGASEALAKAVVTHLSIDQLAKIPDDASEAELVAEIQKGMQDLLNDPELTDGRREIDYALQELRKLTGAPPKKPA
jgi:hypothetical protein